MPMTAQQRQLDSIVKRLKRLIIKASGETGIRALSRAFAVSDDDGDHHLDRAEFESCLSRFGISLSASETDALMNVFDIDGDGRIGVTEFLSAFRVGLSPKRKAFIDRCFAQFDLNGDGRLSIEELRRCYDASRHPHVVRGVKTEEEALADFLTAFDDSTNPDGWVSKQEFEQHYSGVSASFADDDEFVEMLAATYHLDDEPLSATHRKPLTAMALEEREAAVDRVIVRHQGEDVVAKLRKLCEQKLKLKLFKFARELWRLDPERSGFIPSCDVDEAVHRCLLHYFFTPEELNVLKASFETRAPGRFDYAALLLDLAGELPPRRLMALERTWKRFPTDRKGLVSVKYLQDNFVADYTPGVAKGLVSKGNELSSFLDHWDVREFPTGKVGFSEFALFYKSVSEGLERDAHFETMLSVSWSVWADKRAELIAALD